jgi:hypothetical protein
MVAYSSPSRPASCKPEPANAAVTRPHHTPSSPKSARNEEVPPVPMASTTGQRALETVFSTPEHVGIITDYDLPNELVVESEKAWEDGQGYSVYKVSKVGASEVLRDE